MEFVSFHSDEAQLRAARYFLEDSLKGAEHPTIALSGGRTPLPLYADLARQQLITPFPVEFYLVDERCVPLVDQASNYHNITEAFRPASRAFLDHFHFFDVSLAPSKAAEKYAEELQTLPRGVFDVVILGIGNDGHTASLFPGSAANREEKALAVHAINEHTDQVPIRDRLTITWPVILAAKRILVLAGKGKGEVIEELRNGIKKFEEFPVHRLESHSHCAIYFLS